ncbi:MAG: cation transporter [Candidatus Lokiarchaeota archaeon]|nr:cation transporter [Candidatus Lokiarchaeota archaeon]
MQKKNKLLFASTVTLSIFFMELFGGIFNNSLALISDSFHVVLDVLALFFSFLAIHLAENVEPTEDYSFGFHRLEILVALMNGLLLGGMSIYIVIESIDRLFHPEPVGALYVLIIAIIGITANLFSILLLKREEKDVNVKSAYFHVLGDTLASVMVIVGSIIIEFTNFYIIDTIVALGIAGILIRGTVSVLRNSLTVLMQKTPTCVNLNVVKQQLVSHKEICSFHDLHVWNLCSDSVILTVHVVLNDNVNDLKKIDELNHKINEELEKQGIAHATIQFETFDSKCKYLKGKALYCIHSDNHDDHVGHHH